LDEALRDAAQADPVGAIVRHRRCGVRFRLEFSYLLSSEDR
jgi:hypothetical protein